MNNRIRELAEQAGFNAFTTFIIPNHQGHISTELEKFAELIVRECYAWAQLNGGLGGECDYTELKQHFGIKE